MITNDKPDGIPKEQRRTLTVRYMDRLRGRQSDRISEHSATLYSWEVSRLMRRDLPIVSNSLLGVNKSFDTARRAYVRDAVMELVLQTEFLVGESEQFLLSRDLAVHSVVQSLIVCAEAHQVYRCLIAVDKALARLLCGVVDGHIDLDFRRAKYKEFERAFYAMKMAVIGQKQRPQSASEIAKEIGIE